MTDSPLRKLIPIRHWNGPILGAAAIAELDRMTIEDVGLPGAILMERAAEACVSRILQRRASSRRVAVLVGPGNNGGDGSAIARLLHEFAWKPTIILAAEEDRLRGDAALNFQIAKTLGVRIVPGGSTDEVRETLRSSSIWVDALLGVGNEEAPRGGVATLLEQAMEIADSSTERATHWTLAVDLPTGLGTASGRCPGLVLRADETVALGAPKPAHFLPGGLRTCGETYVGDIGVLNRSEVPKRTARAFAASSFNDLAIRRGADSYKSSSGHVLVLAGSDEMPGAAALCVTAALRAGAGLVSLASDESVRHLTIGREPSVIGVPIERIEDVAGADLKDVLSRYSSFLIGPGFGTNEARSRVLHEIMAALDGRPCVVDADGLTILARSKRASHATGPLILTPHPGELSRLLGQETGSVLDDIPSATANCSGQYRATVCTKAAGAWIADGENTRVIFGAEPMLAAAGSGDVLSGIVAAFAYSFSPIEACARAAYLHVMSGRLLSQRRSGSYATAIEIADAVTDALVLLSRDDA